MCGQAAKQSSPAICHRSSTRGYLILYPGVTEPTDAETYVDLVKQLNQWRAQMEENQTAMEQMLKAQEGTTKEMFQDVYTAWNKHQVQLVRICNHVLQFHIVAQRLPPEKQETSAMELDI